MLDDSTPQARSDLRAAMHAHDFTLRAQFVVREHCPDYHDLISRFAALTGVHGLLNTSFNLHGEPVVGSPADALHTMDQSDLLHAAIGGFLVQKR